MMEATNPKMSTWKDNRTQESMFLYFLLFFCSSFFVFFLSFHFFSVLHLRYTKIDYAQCAAHTVSESICETAASSHENKLFKEKLFKAPFILWKGTRLGEVTEINIPTPLGPFCLVCLVCSFVVVFYNNNYLF